MTQYFSWVWLVLFLCSFSQAQSGTLKARLEWAHTADLRVLEKGIVKEVLILEGQRVAKGEPMLGLDERDFEITLRTAKAKLDKTKIELDQAERRANWNNELFVQGLISENEQHETQAVKMDAEASVAAAQAVVDAAKLSQERSVLVAPFDGIVVAVNAWQGQVILPNLQSTPLIILASADEMVARARVSADLVGHYRPGQDALVSVANQTRPGRIYRIGAVSEGVLERGIAYAVDVIFNVDPRETLRPGQSCSIKLP